MLKNAGTPKNRQLASKEAGLFKELLTLYETRQLKKGLKTADLILKKFPEHGETMCMKGLVLIHMGRRDEGLELVKKGMRLDLTSHICWHVFALIQKGEKNYEEALKSYTQALRFDRENMNLLRDTAHLQTQLRLYDGLVETRNTIVRIRPAFRQHWITLAVAYHLNGNFADAKRVMDHYESSLKNIPNYDIEHSETLLYHVRLLEEMGELSEALSLLDTSAKERYIVDKTSIMEIRARLLSKLESPEAEHAWRVLVEHNPDCYDYYRGYLKNQCANSDETSPEALSILEEFSAQLPKSRVPRRLALNIASGDKFRELATPYLLSSLAKGIPSLFADVKSLYTDTSKLQIIQEILESASDSSDPAVSSEPTTYLWIMYFLAQHHSHLGHYAKALEIIDKAIEHTPTLPELYTCRARTLKRAGDLLGAARSLDDARLLDGQDRFLNTKCAKYRLRAGMVEEAQPILGLFTKKDVASPAADLEDMQSLLYLLEEAGAHTRNGAFSLALKKYLAVQKIFGEVEDDQYDFHGYSLRKFNINIYLNMLSWEDRLRSHPAYVTSALSAARLYVKVHDDPSLAKPIGGTSQLTDAEKKAKKKAKKAAQKNTTVATTTQDDGKKGQSSNEDKGLEPPSKDDDPDGSKALSAPDALERAAKMLSPLTTLVPDNTEVWIVVYDVAIRRKKLLQAVKALNHARTLSPEDPEVHERIAHLRSTAASLPQTPPEPIGSAFQEAVAAVLPAEVSLETFNAEYLQRHSTSARAIFSAAKVSYKLLEAPREEVENVLFGVLRPETDLKIPTALDILAYLKQISSPKVDEFRIACGERYPLSTVFKGPDEIAALKKQVLENEVPGPKDVEPDEPQS